MAADAVEELPGVGPESKRGSRGNPWISVIAISILLPLTSFLLFEFILIPRLKSALNVNDSQVKEEDAKHSQGAGETGINEPLHTYKFKNIVANLSGALKSRYVKVSFILEGSHAEFEKIIAANEIRLIDTTLGILSALSLADLEEPGIKNLIRNDLIASFSTTLDADIIEQLYFSELVVQ